MHVKKGDNVIVLTGKDKGKSGLIARAFPRENKIIIDGINIKKIHEKKKTPEGKGRTIEKAYPIDASNVRMKQ